MEKPDKKQLEIFAKMSPEEKLKLAERLYWDARHLREAALQALHPELTIDEVRARVKREFLLARTD